MIAQNIQEATHTCFSVAQKRVYSLMENNSYPRFLESEFYQELCKKTPISRAAQGTWEMERKEKQSLGWRGSQATAREQHPGPKGWGTKSVCRSARTNIDFGAGLMAHSDAVGGCSGEMAEGASQLLALPFSARAAARGGCAGALLSRPRNSVAGLDRASFLCTGAALCTWALLGARVIGCLFIFPKHPPAGCCCRWLGVLTAVLLLPWAAKSCAVFLCNFFTVTALWGEERRE